jgi:hypothetical protein
MTSTNHWAKESARYYITTITLGDTELEIYGEVVGPEDDIGYHGDVDIHDVRIVAPDGELSTSIWEFVNCSPDLVSKIEQAAFENVL